MKKLYFILTLPLILLILNSCGGNSNKDGLNLYNAGEYIDEDLIAKFEEETGISVNYSTFDSNETALTKMETESFDIVIPSDYAIEQLIVEDKLQKIDWSKITTITQDDFAKPVLDLVSDLKEEENGYDFMSYSVPYFFGNVGICYDRNKVDSADIEREGWAILHDPKYRNKVAYYDSARDGFMAAYKENGFSMNSSSEEETEIAFNWIKKIKNQTNCAFKTDELLSEMPDGKYAIALMYSGDAIYCMMEQNDDVDLDFYVPEKGTNTFIDGMVIPKNARHTESAYKFISFMCEEENAKQNSIYVAYASCIENVYNELCEEEEEFFDYKDYYKVDYRSEVDEMFRFDPLMKLILNDYWIKLKLS